MTTDLPLPDRLARRISDLLEDEPEEVTVSVISLQRTGAVLNVLTTAGPLTVTVSASVPSHTLLPCPLCGGTAEMRSEKENEFTFWRSICCGCGVGMRWYGSKHSARRAWNDRAQKGK